jgi:hypothetical protein
VQCSAAGARWERIVEKDPRLSLHATGLGSQQCSKIDIMADRSRLYSGCYKPSAHDEHSILNHERQGSRKGDSCCISHCSQASCSRAVATQWGLCHSCPTGDKAQPHSDPVASRILFLQLSHGGVVSTFDQKSNIDLNSCLQQQTACQYCHREHFRRWYERSCSVRQSRDSAHHQGTQACRLAETLLRLPALAYVHIIGYPCVYQPSPCPSFPLSSLWLHATLSVTSLGQHTAIHHHGNNEGPSTSPFFVLELSKPRLRNK